MNKGNDMSICIQYFKVNLYFSLSPHHPRHKHCAQDVNTTTTKTFSGVVFINGKFGNLISGKSCHTALICLIKTSLYILNTKICSDKGDSIQGVNSTSCCMLVLLHSNITCTLVHKFNRVTVG